MYLQNFPLQTFLRRMRIAFSWLMQKFQSGAQLFFSLLPSPQFSSFSICISSPPSLPSSLPSFLPSFLPSPGPQTRLRTPVKSYIHSLADTREIRLATDMAARYPSVPRPPPSQACVRKCASPSRRYFGTPQHPSVE